VTERRIARLDEFFKKKQGIEDELNNGGKAKDVSVNKLNLSDLIREYSEKIKLPEIVDQNKVIYSIEKLVQPGEKCIIVTEKNKVATAILRVLGNGKRRIIKTKWGEAIVYDVFWNMKKFTIIPLRGHITEYATTADFSGRWEKTDPRDIINPEVLINITKEKQIAEALKREAIDASALIIATDADEEGANIGLEAYEIIRKAKGSDLRVAQMWFISLRPSELRSAFLHPIEPKWSWAYAVEARRVIDAMVGFSATRELTLCLRDYLKQLKVNVFSIGRVQTPTLYLLYLREREIKDFKPTPYWSLKAELRVDKEAIITAFHEKSPFYSHNEALMAYNSIRNAREAIVKHVEEKEEKKLPPLPLDTTKALSMLNEILGLSSKKAMDILEDLYLNGLITYPRTETDKYPKNYDHTSNLRILTKLPGIGIYAKKALTAGGILKRNGTKLIGDHLPITPIDAAEPNDLRLTTKIHAQVYELIVRRYVALFLEPVLLLKKKFLLMINEEPFVVSGVLIKHLGFAEVYPYGLPKETLSFSLKEGDKLEVVKIYPPEKNYTKPPQRLSDGELIKIMEKLGLGTKSTRPDHIETLIRRKYIQRRGNRLIVTDIGYFLASFLEKIWPDFVKPYFSAYVHTLMRKVMNDQLDWREMISIIRDKYLSLFDELRKSKEALLGGMKEAIAKHIIREKVINCPKCNGVMILMSTKSGKVNLLQCTKCGFNVIIPRANKYEVTGLKCIICKTEILIMKREGRNIYICPICWRERGPCYKCPDLERCSVKPLVQKEKERFVVGRCKCGGNLIFLKKRRLVVCNKCGKKFYLPKKGTVTLLKSKCSSHGLRLFSIRDKNKRYHYCILCGYKKM